MGNTVPNQHYDLDTVFPSELVKQRTFEQILRQNRLTK